MFRTKGKSRLNISTTIFGIVRCKQNNRHSLWLFFMLLIAEPSHLLLSLYTGLRHAPEKKIYIFFLVLNFICMNITNIRKAVVNRTYV